MSWPYSQILTAVTGGTLAASDWNSEQQNHINNNIPASIDDDSPNVAGMQTTVDPYPASVEALPTDLKGELERLRYQMAFLIDSTYWYQRPAWNSAITPVTATATSTGLNNRLAMFATQVKAGFGLTNWYDAITRKGQILQIVTATSTTIKTVTSNAYAATNLTATITPSATTSKILVLACGPLANNSASHASYLGIFGTTSGNLQGSSNFLAEMWHVGNSVVPATIAWVDAPGTVAAQTYTVQIKNDDNASSASFGDTNGTQFMLLLEFAQ